MFEWIVILRVAAFGSALMVVLAYIADIRRRAESKSLVPEWLVSIFVGLFVWLMGWLG
jgi:hypothetical protein